jgi:hypothetical protein
VLNAHSHVCLSCGNYWIHGDNLADNIAAHTCSVCKRQLPPPWIKFQMGIVLPDNRLDVRGVDSAQGTGKVTFQTAPSVVGSFQLFGQEVTWFRK